MKYVVVIDQRLLAKTGLDFNYGALLVKIREYCTMSNSKIEAQRVKHTDGQKYTWMDYSMIIEELPMLQVKGPSGLTPKIQRLEKLGFIATYTHKGHKKYFTITEKTKLVFKSLNASWPDSLQVIENQRSNYPTNPYTNNPSTINQITNGEELNYSSQIFSSSVHDSNSTQSSMAELVVYFKHLFLQRFGREYVLIKSKDLPSLKRVVETVNDVKKLKVLVNRYFRSENSFIQKTGYSIYMFCQQINNLNSYG